MPDQADRNVPVPTFDEFPVPSYDDWRDAAEESLKGAPFDKTLTTRTYEGITLQPLYRQDDIAGLPHLNTLPGHYPFVRGSHAAGYLTTPWAIAQAIPYPTPADFNTALQHDLERGQTAIYLVLDQASQNGLNPDQANSGQVGHGGVSIASLEDFAIALDGVNLTTTPIYIEPGVSGPALLSMLVSHAKRRNIASNELTGCIETDPLGWLATTGEAPTTSLYDDLAAMTAWAAEHVPHLGTVASHSAPYFEGGASAVQELAFALATGVTYLREMQDRNIDINTAAAHMQFVFQIGANFFMEVAKLRAARLLWAQIMEAFGGSTDAQQMTLHARTGSLNKTTTDPYVNMLRTTVEALAGAVGGVQRMTVDPFDAIQRAPDEFSRRIARNQQIILQEECSLTRLIDPAGGSWYVEYLTDQLARKSWALFQEVESSGGMLAALRAGWPQQQIADIAQQRSERLAQRRDVLVGTNMYANITEQPLAPRPTPANTANKRAAQYQDRSPMRIASTNMDDLIAAISDGATLGDITAASTAIETTTVRPVGVYRMAEPFEQLRDAARSYTEANGHPPQIFMANMGPVSQHKVRADFSAGFFEVGGFEMLNNSGFATPNEAAQAAIESGAPTVVICSTDDTYPDIVPPLVGQIKAARPETVVILAGYPQDQIDAHRAAGVDEFIHFRADCYAINRKLQELTGVRS